MMSIKEFAKKYGVPERIVRYALREGFLDRANTDSIYRGGRPTSIFIDTKGVQTKKWIAIQKIKNGHDKN